MVVKAALEAHRREALDREVAALLQLTDLWDVCVPRLLGWGREETAVACAFLIEAFIEVLFHLE